MTEKRFTITQDFEEHHRQIRDNGHIIMGCFVEPQAEVIVDLLNELAEENQDLHKKEVELGQNYLRLLEENEQLKQRLELYGELYPTGKWITELTSEELEKELEE